VKTVLKSTTRDEIDVNGLENLTVKELKQLLKENKLDQERGILTRLKRKQDLVDYLRANLSSGEEDDVDWDEDEDDEQNNEDPASTSHPIGIELSEVDFSIIDDDSDGQIKDDTHADNFSASDVDGDTESTSPPVGIELAEGDFSIIDDEDFGDEVPAEANHPTASTTQALRKSPELWEMIPNVLKEKMASRGITSLLPIQQASFEGIYNGEDAILQSPTGSGKTLAFVLPLLSADKKRPWQRKKGVASPRILTICPSRELAKQVGKEYEKLAGKAFGVATVFGGVPLERHVALLKHKPQIVVTTPGRLRELVREKHLEYSQVATLVLDEADLLLDKSDSPDVFAAIEDIEKALEEGDEKDPEYQMVLVSATIGKNVKDFAKEMEFPKTAFIKVESDVGSKTLIESTSSKEATVETGVSTKSVTTNAVTTEVGHWHMSCKASVRPEITSNLISVLSPRLTIVFVPTKSETESVASFLSEQAGGGATIRILHGDMSQSARSRCISLIREEAARKDRETTATIGGQQILVATDVASRGLDLPNVDLVVQFGLPRIAGKEGTINPELYAHRTGRTGRFRATPESRGNDWRPPSNRYQTNNAVALFDPAVGEGKLIRSLVEEVRGDLGVAIRPMAIPSSARVVDAAYTRLSSNLIGGAGSPSDLAGYFRDRLETDDRIDTSDPETLLDRLTEAMVALSKLDPSMSPLAPTSSLMNGDPATRSLRLFPKDVDARKQDPLRPPAVTAFCKARGSGKLGRVVICGDGSAVFDLPTKRANRLIETILAEEDRDGGLEYGLEMPSSLPEI